MLVCSSSLRTLNLVFNFQVGRQRRFSVRSARAGNLRHMQRGREVDRMQKLRRLMFLLAPAAVAVAAAAPMIRR